METTVRQDDLVGFAGLTSLVSIIPSATRPQPIHDAQEPQTKPDAPKPAQPKTSKFKNRSAENKTDIILLTVASLGVLAVIVLSSTLSKSPNTSSSPQYTSPPSTIKTEPKPSGPSYTAPLPEIVEERPVSGNSSGERLLSRNQIYYCLIESERIDILKTFTNEASQKQIDHYNGRVRDYSTVCQGKYYKPDMDAAKREFDAKIASIRAQFTASLTPAKPATSIAQPPPALPSTPRVTPAAPSASAPSAAPLASVAPAPLAPIAEAIPPYGKGHRHSREQLYYCWAESIRLESAKKTIDSKSQSQLDSLNGKLADFTARCTKYHSNPADRDPVNKQLAAKRAALKAEGVALANSWR